MRSIYTVVATVTVFGASLSMIEQNRRSSPTAGAVEPTPDRIQTPSKAVIRAAGRIEGRTDEIELRARVAEQIRQIHVVRGQWVSAGEALVSLDSDRLESERDLAGALLAEAEAKQLRLENGYRQSEIETAKEEYEAAKARLLGAQKAYDRAQRLVVGHAVSQQTLDDLHTKVTSLAAMSAAAKRRIETLELPARSDELLVAMSAVRAAEARLRIAQINLERCQIKAPIDGQILSIEAELGELTGPDSQQPLVIMSDTTRLRTLAEIDEYDALTIRMGQAAHITSDGTDGILARGKIVEIEPKMNRKKLFGQWANERSDTYSRRVWIELQDTPDLPIGLPVDVYIDADKERQP